MKILQLSKYYPPTKGGIETHVSALCEELVRAGHDVTCYAFGQVKKDTRGVKVEAFKSSLNTPPFSLKLLLRTLLMRNSFDIVHVHAPNPWAEICALIAKPKKLIVTYHSDIIGKRGACIYLPIQRMLLRRANRIICASKQYAETSEQLKKFADKCTIIPHGIPPQYPASIKKIRQIRSLGERPLFLFVGRLIPYKGVGQLIKAMRDVPGTLIIVGNGPLLCELEDLSRSAHLEGRAIFKTNVTDEELPSYYKACDALVLPSISRAESFGIVQLEAMSHGKPVISTRLGTGTDEVNSDNITGLIADPSDSNSITNKLMTLSRDSELRKRLGRNAKNHARKYSAKNMTSATSSVYESLL